MSKQWFIYVLVDPRVTSGRACDEVRYVGVTTQVRNRYKTHLETGAGDHYTKCARWLQSVVRAGFDPIMKIVDRGSGDTWKITEQFWIRFYREEVGSDLTNATEGGEGTIGYRHVRNYRHSPEVLLRMSESMKGKNLGRIQTRDFINRRIDIQREKRLARLACQT